MKMRPYIRFDGFYRCKMKYNKYGEAVTSEYAPLVEVISYKYIRFLPNGEVFSIYSPKSPKRIFDRLKNLFLTKSDFTNAKSMSKFELITGRYECFNDKIVVR